MADLFNRRPVDLNHHGVNHDPNQERNDHIDMGKLQPSDHSEDVWGPQTETHTCQYTQADPDG